MKRLLILFMLASSLTAFGRAESSLSSWVYVNSVEVVPQNRAAYVTLSSTTWGTNVYTVDLSESNRYGTMMFSQIVSAITNGRQIAFTVSLADSEYGLDCEHGSSPQCEFGDRIKQLAVRKP